MKNNPNRLLGNISAMNKCLQLECKYRQEIKTKSKVKKKNLKIIFNNTVAVNANLV